MISTASVHDDLEWRCKRRASGPYFVQVPSRSGDGAPIQAMASKFQKLRETSRPRLDDRAVKAWAKRLGSLDYELATARLTLEYALDKLAETDWHGWADVVSRQQVAIAKIEAHRQTILDQEPRRERAARRGGGAPQGGCV